MLGVNEKRFLVQHGPYDYKYRLNENVCNLRHKWNCNKCWWETTNLDDQSSSKNNYVWIPSTCKWL